MKLLETYHRVGIDFTMWYRNERCYKIVNTTKIVITTTGTNKKYLMDNHGYTRIPRKINQQDSLG